MNIICYADDIAILAPTGTGLQMLVNLVSEILNELGLKMNALKSSYIVFRKNKKLNFESNLNMSGQNISRKCETIYLGTTLNEFLNIFSDTERVTKSFLAQFHSFYSKFYFIDTKILHFLFKSYATSFYGVELWYSFLGNKNIFRKPSIAYHGAIKKICRLNKWDSNHEACRIANQEIFIHLLSK